MTNPIATSKVVLIGEAPGPKSNPAQPLCGYPKNMSGYRLCKMTGLTLAAYHRLYGRANLLSYYPGLAWKKGTKARWPVVESRAAARAILPFLRGRRVIMLGRRVASAFEFPASLPFLDWQYDYDAAIEFACLPHPSGQNRWYKKPVNVAAAMKFMHETTAEIKSVKKRTA